MKAKNIVICTIVTCVIAISIIITVFQTDKNETAKVVYQVYLDGQKIGAIADADELYNLINEDQQEIKNQYSVDRVYPPNGFDIIKHYTYNDTVTDANELYSQIKDQKPFTIKGYIVTMRATDDDGNNTTQELYVLDENIFRNALEKVVTTFVDAIKLEQYLTNSQPEIIDTGELIEKMEFAENITIKEANIDADAKIFTDETTLLQYLLFGSNFEKQSYIVQEGDTISSISEKNQLNVQEFLIANPQFISQNNLLVIGEEVSITLINPVLALVYDMKVVRDDEVPYETEYKYDYSKYSSYTEIEQDGENGIRRNTVQVRVVNGEEQQGAQITNYVNLKDPVKKIIVKGAKGGSGPVNIKGSNWGWPTAQPYYISSEFTWRWGKHHDGLDITGTGYGSPIFAVQSGTVISSGQGSHIIGGTLAGIAVTIDHHNGFYTLYAHMSKTLVVEGQEVTKGERIGEMGNTGYVSPRPTKNNPTAGTHLHFSVFEGYPYQGGSAINPRRLWS